MIQPGFHAPTWPSGSHYLLLRAALHPDPATATSAWSQWRAALDFDRIDYASMRLVPLLLRRATELGLDDPNAGRYRGLHRRAWVRSQQLFQRIHHVIEGLAAEGIPTLILKGAALAPTFYGDTGLRPMGDADVLVPHAQASRAIEWFVRNSWKPEPPQDASSLRQFHLTHNHAWGFDSGGDQQVDLHWKLLHLGTHPSLDDRFWRDATELRLPGITARTLSPTHHLFHACIHGVPFCPVPSLRWIADAAFILRASPTPIDWQEFLRCTADFHVAVIAFHALTWLRQEIDAPIPEAVLAELQSRTPASWESAEFEHLIHHPPSLHPAFLWHRHQRQFALHPDPAHPNRLASYLAFVATRWDLSSRWDLPFAFAEKALLFARHRFSR